MLNNKTINSGRAKNFFWRDKLNIIKFLSKKFVSYFFFMEIKSLIIESITKFYSYMTISISIYTVTQLLKFIFSSHTPV